MARPTDDDRGEALRRFLIGVARGVDAHRLVADLVDLHARNDTFPGEVFMELGADALALAGVTRGGGFGYGELMSRHLAEVEFRGKERRRMEFAVLAAFAVHGGLEPDLLDEVAYWIEQYWSFAVFAAVAIVRGCADVAGMSVAAFVAELAVLHHIDMA